MRGMRGGWRTWIDVELHGGSNGGVARANRRRVAALQPLQRTHCRVAVDRIDACRSQKKVPKK